MGKGTTYHRTPTRHSSSPPNRSRTAGGSLFITVNGTAAKLGPKAPMMRNNVEGQNDIRAWWETATGIQNDHERVSVNEQNVRKGRLS